MIAVCVALKRWSACGLAALAVLMSSRGLLHAESGPTTLVRGFPPGAVGFAEAQNIGGLLERIERSAWLSEYLASPQYSELRELPQHQTAMAARAILETQLGMDLWSAGRKLLGAQVAVAAYIRESGERPEVLMLLRMGDAEFFERIRSRAEPFLVLAEAQNGNLDRTESLDGTRLASFRDRAFACVHQQVLMLSSSRQLLTAAVELAREGSGPSLADDGPYRQMTEKMGAAHLLRLYVDVQALLAVAPGPGIPDKLDNALGSLLVGGISKLLTETPYAGLTFDVHENSFLLRAAIAADYEQLAEPHRVFFADPMGFGTPSVPAVPGLQAGFTLHRDFAGWYRHREELLQSQTLPAFDQFESGLANLLPGKDFGTDVLPLIGSNLTFVSAVQSYPHLKGRPAVEFPGFAIIIDLAEPNEAADVFRLFFQTLSSILNLQAGQQGREPMVMDSESYGGVQITYGRFLKKPTGEKLPVLFNFVPSAAHVGDKYVISSSHELCRQLVDVLKNAPDDTQRANRNLNFEVHPESIALSVEANRGTLEAGGIREGKTLERARSEIDVLLRLLRAVQLLRLSTSVEADSFELRFEGKWK